jgi:hypothetical protein
MKQITMHVPNTMLEAVLAFCRASGIRNVAVVDDEVREEEGLYFAMQEADRTDTVPTAVFIAKLRAKAANK